MSFYKVLFVPFISLSLLNRIILIIYARYNEQINLKILKILEVLAAGTIADIITFLYIYVPIHGVLLTLPKKLRNSQVGYYLKHVSYLVFVFALCFNITAEFTFWEEFGSRFNFIAVDYLIYTKEVIGNIVESYPLHYILPVVLGFSLVFYLIFIKIVKLNECKLNLKEFWIITPLLVAVSSCYKPQWIEFKNNQYYTELSKNGIYSLFYAYRNNHLKYDSFYKTLPEKELLTRLQKSIPGLAITTDNSSATTQITTKDTKSNKKNLVLITVESLSAEFLERYGNQQNITPFLNNLIRQSLNFTNYYATGTRTVRGLEAMALSVPPTPGTSLVRKPNNENLFSIGTVLKQNGYENKFIYGGFGYFDNMNYFFSHNNFLTIDRSTMPADQISFANVWGIADEDLFKKSIEEADKSFSNNQPFFLFIMTTSNHRPFTYPENRINIPSGTGRLGGVKYSDYAIEQFITSAKDKPWFNNTIFVITADHCASSAGKTKIPINKYHIPLMIYSPSHIKPREVHNLASQIDLSPTLLSLLDISYKNKFFGTDMLTNPQNRAFLATYQLLGYMTNSALVVLSPKKKIDLYKIDLKKNSSILQKFEMSDIIKDAITYYQGADYLYTNGLMKE